MLGHLVTNEVALGHVVVALGPLPSTRAGGMREAMNNMCFVRSIEVLIHVLLIY